ncbi:hypothetical protein HPULCUR_001435 [Helicostylum pulchrum]|uniref:Uncharacterized protein n=1 Tax=Helicostylum pulchrum TaxID=562976 RepID=A0ABP9XMN9_9FUNG
MSKSLPESLANILIKLKGKNDFQSIDRTFQEIRYDRRTQPAEYCDCQSSASSSNRNSQRGLGTNQRLIRQANGDCSDLTFKYLSSELGCVEIGLVDHEVNGTKDLQESKLKSPKMMRSFCKQMIEQYKIKADKIKTMSFIMNGSFITAQVMTFTKGSVGILFSSPRLKMPENISQVPALLPPILALVYNCTLVIKETAQLLKDESTHINLNPFTNSDYFFPDSFVEQMLVYF